MGLHTGIKRNDGVVKINDGNGIMPRFGQGDPLIQDTWQQFVYPVPLTLSTATSWPQNMIAPTDADVYLSASGTFVENLVDLQVHSWRIQLEYVKATSNTNLQIRLRNTISGFTADTAVAFANDAGTNTTGGVSVLLITIADSASLPAPLGTGLGYVLEIMSDDNTFQNDVARYIELKSIARVSMSKQ